jgi:hypothetical protein
MFTHFFIDRPILSAVISIRGQCRGENELSQGLVHR